MQSAVEDTKSAVARKRIKLPEGVSLDWAGELQ